MTSAACPVCSSGAVEISGGEPGDAVGIETALSATPPPLDPEVHYRMRRCEFCSLEFADPMLEPGAGFYQWLTRSGFHYPVSRWEWSACQSLIEASSATSRANAMVVVDVGCGDGGFLHLATRIPGVRAIGVDHNPDVIDGCRSDGFEVAVGGLDRIGGMSPDGADVITFWHVVEHVADPVGLLLHAKGMLRAGGSLCFSVPISPMSYEHSWPDPFNAPPHHLTRWNIASLNALADRLGMPMELHLPRASSLVSRAMRALVLQAGSPSSAGRVRKALRTASFLLARPWRLPTELVRQWRHPRHQGRVLPDVVLVRLKS